MRITLPLALAGLLLLLLVPVPGAAHEAPSGWAYPLECCSDHDCKPVDDKDVSEDASGYTVRLDGAIFFVKRDRAKFSPDGHYHACHMAGASELICFFRPPQGS
jgi:hypothetical protein